MSSKAYEVVTERIIKMLESGTIPWRKTWCDGASLGEHQNLISQHQYRGINAILTGSQGYTDPYWLTYKQAQELGGQVKSGEKGTPIVFWQFGATKDGGKEKKWAFARYSTVFNIAQIEGIDTVKALSKKRRAERIQFNPIEECEKVLNGYPNRPALEFKEQRAFYRPSTDSVNMPKKESFDSVESFYATLFHELSHSTGHASRLAREGITDKIHFGTQSYSKEELIAEMGSAFLCAKTGIQAPALDNNTAAYIKNWLDVLKGDPRLVMTAASAAQRAADHILGKAEPKENATEAAA